MKRKIAAGFIAICLAAGFIGCEKAADAEKANTPETETASIDVIMKTTDSEYWSQVKAGAKAAGKDLGVNVDVKGTPSEDLTAEQANLLKADIESKAYDAYVVAPCSPQISDVIEGYRYPFIAMDTNIEAEEVVSFVGTDNETAAKAGGVAAVEAAKAAGWDNIEAICIAGVPGDKASEARKAGFTAGVKEAGASCLDKEYYTNGHGETAIDAINAVMKDYSEGVAIVFCNNDEMAMAAALQAKENKAYENTIFVGFDGIASGCISIKDGILNLSVSQEAYEMGYTAVETAVKALNDEEVEATIYTSFQIIDASNADARLEELKK